MEPLRVGDEIQLPELARQQGLSGPTLVVEKVIRGGMSVCALVRPPGMGASYALKVPAAELVADPGAMERFLDELRVWLTLSACEGVVEALCVFRFGGLPAVVSRWMEGGSLRHKMSRRDPEFFYGTMLRLVGALEWAAKKRGVLHRDLKPENVLFDDLGRAHLSDWGIADFLEEGTDGRRRAPGGTVLKGKGVKARLILGTVTYASPEQLLGGVPVDHRADIYSLGTIMYEWESGDTPFSGGTWEELRKRKLFENAKTLGGFLRRTTFGAEEVIARCLARERGNRYDDYRALADALVVAADTRGVRVMRHTPRMRYQTDLLDAEALKGRMAVHGFVSAGGTDGRRASVAWERAREAVDKAQALEREENWAEAHELYARFFMPSLVRDLPDDPLQQTLALGVARTLLRLGRPDEAFRSLDALAGASVRSREATLLAVEASLGRGDPGQAERIAFSATAGGRDDGELLGLLLRAQIALGQDEAALETVRRLMAVEGPTPAILMSLSDLLVQTAVARPEAERPEALRRLGEAVAHLGDQNLREAEPEETLMTASLALAAAERWEEALAGLDAAPAAEGDAARARAELSTQILVESGRYGECVSRAQGWLSAWPSSVALRRLAAQGLAFALAEGLPVQGGEKSGEAARRALESGLRDTPEPGILLALASSFEWAGDRRKALDLLEGGRATFAGDVRVRIALARMLEREGQLPRAAAIAEEAAAAGPYRPEAWRMLAQIRGALGQKAEAAAASRKAADAERDLAAAWRDGAKAGGEAAAPYARR